MFWRFGGYQSIPTINTLLDKPDVPVEEVLDEADLLQELKENNTKLIEYLRDDNVLKRLLDYIISPSLIDDDDDEFDDEDEEEEEEGKEEEGAKSTKEEVTEAKDDQAAENDGPANDPPAVDYVKQKRKSTGEEGVSLSPDLTPEERDEAEQVRLKYAYVASELLSAPTWSVIEAMMCHETALRDFWRFLWSPAPLSSIQTSYFVKVNEVLLDKKPVEMVSFIMSLDDVVNQLVRHVDNPLVMDLLLKVISLDRVNGSLGVTEWLYSNDLIPILLAYFEPEHTSSTQTSAGEFLKALITISANAALNEQPCIGPNSLTRQLVSGPCVDALIKCIHRGGNALTVAVGVVIEIIRKNNPDYDPESVGGRDAPPTIHDPIYLGTLLRAFGDNIPEFMALILSPKRTEVAKGGFTHVERTTLHTSWGEDIETLGFDRFKICELMAELLHCSNMGLHNEAGSDDFMTHRDIERERLREQGLLMAHNEDGSSFVYPNASNDDTINGGASSLIEGGSPDDMRRIEEDSFEDVAASGVIVDKPQDHTDDNAEPETKSGFSPISKLEMDDDLVDEPLTPPNMGESQPEASSSPQPPKSQHVEPESPTTSSLREKVEGFNIDTPKKDTPVAQNSAGTPNQAVASTNIQSPAVESSTTDPVVNTAEIPSEGKDSEDKPQSTQESKNTKTDIPTVETTSTNIMAGLGIYKEYVRVDADNQPVVGDYLKIMFYKHKVIPTVFSFFFRFAWNNFLHHVVYDVVQQVLNGPTEDGFNHSLIVDLFETGEITVKIVEGQRRSEETEKTQKMRMGYMGHLTLIAEEVVRFTDRQPPEELSAAVMDKVLHPDWADYVERILSETRERENAILGGVKPDASMCHRQAVLNAISNNQDFTGSSALANAGLNGGASNSAFEGFDFMNQDSTPSGGFGFNGFGGSSLLSGFGGSSDDEDEDMDDPEDEMNRKDEPQGTDTEGANSSGSSNAPMPILPPPSAPLTTGPSRARLQLAARLARQHEANNEAGSDDNGGLQGQQSHSDESRGKFPISSAAGSSALPQSYVEYSSPPSFLPPAHAVPSGYLSSSSSDGSVEIGGSERQGFDMDDFDDDDEDIGDMITPAGGIASTYDNDEEDSDDGLITAPLGYSSFLGNSHYLSGGSKGASLSEDMTNSSDEEDDGLVEIMVPGKSRVTS